jgi:exonuclease III
MLGDFLPNQNNDVICIQEVSTSAINNIANYNTLLNIGTEGRGTAIITKEACSLSNIGGYRPEGGYLVESMELP